MAKCTYCGTQNSDDSKYCKSCGTRLAMTTYVTCRKCGAANQANSLFCHMCGERMAVSGSTRPSVPPTRTAAPQTPSPEDAPIPEWLQRLYQSSRDKTLPIKARLVPTHELLRMANAIGVDVDYSTLRFWQKRGLVSKPVRGPVDAGRGTRGYYDPSLIDRLAFIREIQKSYAMGLDAIRAELERLDQQIERTGETEPRRLYQKRLAELQAEYDMESRKTLLDVVCKALKLDPMEIETAVVYTRNGQALHLLGEETRAQGQVEYLADEDEED